MKALIVSSFNFDLFLYILRVVNIHNVFLKL